MLGPRGDFGALSVAGGPMRFKVMVTKVEVAEVWVRATDEEAAAKKVGPAKRCLAVAGVPTPVTSRHSARTPS